jgi:2-hydroxychromene-2-carboxylate isomerase
MVTRIDVYYDFRSPYAYFTSHRIRRGEPAFSGVAWIWQPVSIDILLNLQAGRDPCAPYLDPLPAPKRTHLIADIRRLTSYYGLPMRSPKPPRPNSIPALCLAALLKEEPRARFTSAVFDALWQEQRDISDAEVLANCLTGCDRSPDAIERALEASAQADLADATAKAYEHGVFGVPTFVCNGDLFFGNDRLDLLAWTAAKQRPARREC